MSKVVVCGAGFGGLRAALDIKSKRKNAEVILVNSGRQHVFVPALYKVAAGGQKSEEIIVDLKKLCSKKKIILEQGQIKEIDSKKNLVVMGKKKISYDYLVLGLGAQGSFFGVPGADKYSYRLKTIGDAQKIAKKLKSFKAKFSVIVIGAGHSGIEFTGELADNFPKTEIVLCNSAPTIVPTSPKAAGEKIKKSFMKKGINLILGTPVTKITKKGVELGNGNEIKADMIVWTAGIAINRIFEKSSLDVDIGGVRVNQWLQVPFSTNIFVVGDAASIVNNKYPVPKNAHNAIDEGTIAAKNISAMLVKRPPSIYKYNDFPILVSYGKSRGLFIYKNFVISGFWVNWIKKFVEKSYLIKIKI